MQLLKVPPPPRAPGGRAVRNRSRIRLVPFLGLPLLSCCLSLTFHCLSTAFPRPVTAFPLPFLDLHCLSLTRHCAVSVTVFPQPSACSLPFIDFPSPSHCLSFTFHRLLTAFPRPSTASALPFLDLPLPSPAGPTLKPASSSRRSSMATSLLRSSAAGRPPR